jgi:hypothetical protein
MTQEKNAVTAEPAYSRTAVLPVTGHESFIGIDATVLDFWQWAVSDLRMNTTRSMLAEFFVALAVGSTATKRVEWDNYDILTPEGIKIEVKASGYRQSWGQKKKSVPTFGGFIAREYAWETGSYIGEPKVRADVFVFALQTSWEADDYNVLDVDQWEFYIVPANIIRDCNRKSVGMALVRQHGQYQGRAVRWRELHQVICETARQAGALD